MGSLYRSEKMSLCQLFLHADSAYNTVGMLGELGIVQLIDVSLDGMAGRNFVVESSDKIVQMLHTAKLGIARASPFLTWYITGKSARLSLTLMQISLLCKEVISLTLFVKY